MKKPSLRLGMDEFFPTKYYYDVMKMIIQKNRGMRYKEIAGNDSNHGIKLFRMESQGLLVKKERGLYEVTPYGRKVVSAVDAYKKEMDR